ncbi:programmed cell death protein 2 [Nephila pilipes]|uniref:Programmed cell death protein 2 n=1 Tax=Nephila pilipes TaxID=299642 RepID=A0A8X6PDY1_NEPPI|nr:programmed cell death protein 2 [Nephila pilipes]
MASASVSVELGFLEKRTPWKLQSKFFPSKFGGTPAWLRLNNLPNRSDILCKTCNKPLSFILQVYAPIQDIESAFHRTLFLFACVNGKCNPRNNNTNFVVFRNQLPRKNEIYSFEPPVYNEKLSLDPSASKYQPLCAICGCAASLKCSKCSEVDYCCEDHQDLDWKWNHKNVCGKESSECGTKKKNMVNKFLLPEYELCIETEELPSTTPEKSDTDKMEEYRQFMKSVKAPKEMQDMPLDDLDIIMKENDKAFNKFQKRIKLEPEQVLRYQREETPLWISAEHVPSAEDIPNCSCGAKRIFEFQIMPQLLSYISLDGNEDTVDWGTLAVYTCSKSCEQGIESYAREFIWKQDVSDNQQQ